MLENADLSRIPSTSLAHSQNNKDFYPQKYEERTKLLQIYFAINLLNVSSHKDYINKARNRALYYERKDCLGLLISAEIEWLKDIYFCFDALVLFPHFH